MKKIFIGTMLMVMATLSAWAQSKNITVTGRVLEAETNQPAIQANVQLLHLPDSAYTAGIATTLDGYFTLPKVKAGKYVLKVSYIGFKNKLVPLQLTDARPNRNVGTLTLETDAVLLAEAVITAEVAQVQAKEDTLVYNAAAYRTPEGAMLEELVKKIPGAEVDDDGNVKINGKDLSKILVNGKEFFGGDVKTGLQNLPVDMVENLKTYDKKSDMARITGIDDGEEETVLDLTVKKGMNQGVFGNIDLGAGTEDRYMGRAMINYFRDNTQVNFIVGANNVNDRGFSGGGGGPRWSRNQGLVAPKTLGVNFATESEKLELGGSARYNYSDNDILRVGSEENFLTTGNTFVNSNSKQRNKSQRFNADFRLEWKPDTMTNIIFRPNVSYSKTDNLSLSESGTFNKDPYTTVPNLNPNDYLALGEKFMSDEDPYEAIRVNAINSGSLADNSSLSVNGTLQLNRKLNSRGRNITFRGRFNYSDADNNSYTESDNYYFLLNSYLGGDSVLVRNQYVKTPTKTYNYRAQLTYSEPIARATFLQFSYQFQYKYSESDKKTYDLQNYTDWNLSAALPNGYEANVVDSLGKYAEYHYYNHDASVALRFIRPKFQLSVGASFQPQHTKLSYKRGEQLIDTTRNVFNYAPNVDLRIRFSKTSQLRLTYRGSSSQPSMENLLPIVDNSNPQNIKVGNPGLKPSFTHRLRFFYNTYNAEKQRGIISHVNFSMTQNSISNIREYNPETGGWRTTPENINGNWNAFGMFGFNTALPNKKYTINTFSNASYSNNVGYLTTGQGANAVTQKNTTTSLSLNERLNAAYRNDWFEFGVNGSISYTIEKDKLTPANNQEPYTFSYGANTQITLPWKMSLTTNIANQSRRGYTDSSMNRNEVIWNAQLSQTFLKGNATVSLEFYDILKQQSNITRSLTASGRSVYEYNGVNSYCMLHFIYRLSIFGSKEAREKMMNSRGFGRGPGGFGPPPGGRRPF
ncbi:MAG: TonB-dependent receptor [Bacteroides sp.]|nr:TonB-dependent receptor [Bacteroides sp.]